MAAEQPKKPMTAYFIYLSEQRPAIVKQLGEQAKVRGMVAKTGAEQWRNLSAEDKAPYEKKAVAAKSEYDAAVATFKESGGEIVRKRKADKNIKKGKDKDAPKKPSGGGYGQYLAQHREEIVKSLPAGSNATTDVAKAAGSRWKALSEAEKKPYDEKYAAKMKEYQVAMEAYKALKGDEIDNGEDEHEEQEEKPAKRAKKEMTPTPKAAAGRGTGRGGGRGAAKSKEPEALEINATVLAEACKLGYEVQLKNLAGRQDVKDLGKSDKELLSAIKDSKGLVNPARRALLGA